MPHGYANNASFLGTPQQLLRLDYSLELMSLRQSAEKLCEIPNVPEAVRVLPLYSQGSSESRRTAVVLRSSLLYIPSHLTADSAGHTPRSISI